MSKPKWTNEQLKAIEIINKNLLVSAGAGSGKTAVLVERIINRISNEADKVDIDRLLVMTFTKAAAYEMKERIRNSLNEKTRNEPDNQNLMRQLLLINRAIITTIHSFCSEVIRSNYNLLDIDPVYSICDETKSNQYKQIAIDKTLLEFYENKNDIFYKLVNMYGVGNDDSKLIDLVYSIHRYIMSTPEPAKWLENKLDYYKIDNNNFFDNIWGIQVKEYVILELNGYLSQMKKALNIIKEDEVYNGYYNTLIDDFKMIEKLNLEITNDTWDTFRNKILNFSFSRLGRNKKEAEKIINELIKDIRKKVKKGINDIQDLFINDTKEQYYILNEIKPVLEELGNVVIKFKENYDLIKKKNGVLDFNDLEHYCLYCLQNGASIMYKERFIEILVDEYQDSNLVQEEILNLIKKNNNLFLVGDIKQSIYKFRNANPELFNEKYNKYSKNDKHENNIVIELNENFRSRKEVVSFVNHIFRKIMSKDVGDMDYNKAAYLNFGAKYYDDKVAPCELLISHGEDKIISQNDNKLILEIAMIATKIVNLINANEKIFDKTIGKTRNLRYSDIVILLRSVKGITNEYINVFKKYNIPVYADETNTFFDNDDISRVISFLDIVDNPYQDIPLLSIMKSSIFEFTKEELVVITTSMKAQYIYEKVICYNKDDVIKEKINKMLEIIDRYQYLSSIINIDTLIWKFITETNYYYIHTNSKLLERKQKNLRRLFEIAGQFLKTSNSSLFSFLQYVKTHKEGESDLVGAKSFGENDNVVKIMSIHKSKGLEFPVVFLSNCAKIFNNRESRNTIILHRELGYGPEFIDFNNNFKFSTTSKKIISKKIKNENISEEMRILYVALTRAREKLYITGYVKDIEKACLKWSFLGYDNNVKMTASNILHANCYLDWIMATLASHKYGKIINDYSGIQRDSYIHSDTSFNISFIDTLTTKEQFEKKDSIEEKIIIPSITYENLKNKFDWVYKYKNEINLYRKISVTELKKYKEIEKDENLLDIFDLDLIEKPEFIKGSKTNAAKLGTMVHNLMAYLEFDKINDINYIKKSMEGMDLDSSLVNSITKFFNSEIGSRLLKSNEVYREKSFMLPIDTINIFPELKDKIDSSHKTLVQGVIDCMFVENDEVIIIDYKTDYIIQGQQVEKAKKYQIQLDTYEKAVVSILNKKVKEKVIYFFNIDEAINI